MKSLTNKEIAKVFAMYYGKEALIELKTGGYSSSLNIDGTTILNLQLDNDHRYKLNFKLLLTPLSSISDEDAIEVFKILGIIETAEIIRIGTYKNMKFIDYKWKAIPAELNNEDGYSYGGHSFSLTNVINVEVFQYLISKGYDVPLFFGIDHWANGQTTIQLNLAISKTN